MPKPRADFYVSTKGSDNWSGRQPTPNKQLTDGPFASIGKAQQAVRALRASKRLTRPVTVLIRGGTYWLPRPLVFKPEDSGTKQSPTVYAAFPGERPVFSGGRKIPGLKRAGGNLWSVTLPDVCAGRWYFSDLYVNGVRRPRTRLPKEGFFHIAEVISPEERKSFRYAEGDLKAWTNLDDVEVIVFNAWDELRFRIAKLDEATRTITFTGANNWPFGAWGQTNTRYYVENVREALDEPGEWYLDRKTGVLTYWPLPGENMTKAEVIAPVLEELIRLDGDMDKQRFVEHLQLRGLTLNHTGWTLPRESYISMQAEYGVGGVVRANGARSCVIGDCELSRIGKYGIEFARGCQDNRIIGNHIYDMGAGGVKLGEPAIRKHQYELTCRNEVSGNHIDDGGKNYLCAVGIWIGHSATNLIARNHIHGLNYTGISVGWSWGYGPSLATGNKIVHNHIHDLGHGLLSDMGGIYTLGVSPGTVLAYNLIHDVNSYSYGGWGIYLDEGSTDILVENNICYRTKTGGFHQHYGKDNLIRNNIFALAKDGQIQRSRPEEHLSFTFERNIVYWTEGLLLHGKWGDDHYRFDDNLYWNTAKKPIDFAGASLQQWQHRGMDQHSLIADPLFVDPVHADFTLKPGSPAFKLGFKPIMGAGDGKGQG